MEEDSVADSIEHAQDTNMNITSTKQEAQAGGGSQETLYVIRSLNGQDTMIPVIR